MATRSWIGGASDVAGVYTVTPANPAAGDVFTVSVHGKSVSYTVTAADMAAGAADEASAVAAVVAGLAAAWNAATAPELTELTASDASTHLILAADVAGVSHVLDASSSASGSATNEVQSLSIGGGTPTSGTFTLTYDGQTTAAIAYDATAANVETALEALANLDTADVTCSGGPLPGTAVAIEFTGTLAATNVAQITAADVDLDTGLPAVVTSTQGAAGPDTLTLATANAATGKHFWDDAGNWAENAVPQNGDDVYIQNGSVDILYGLDQSAVTLDSLTVDPSYAGNIGLPRINAGSDQPYEEYRDQYLAIGATVVDVGGEGPGSGRIKLDTGTAQTTLNVRGTGSPLEDGIPPLLFKGSHSSNVVNVSRGHVGIAVFGGETATIDVLRITMTDFENDAVVLCGTGVTLDEVDQIAGTLTTQSSMTTIDQNGGELVHLAGSIDTLNLDKGTFRFRSTGTLTAANVGGQGLLDFSQDMRSRTVASCTLFENAELRDPFRTVAFTAGIALHRCSLEAVRLDLGDHYKITPAEI